MISEKKKTGRILMNCGDFLGRISHGIPLPTCCLTAPPGISLMRPSGGWPNVPVKCGTRDPGMIHITQLTSTYWVLNDLHEIRATPPTK